VPCTRGASQEGWSNTAQYYKGISSEATHFILVHPKRFIRTGSTWCSEAIQTHRLAGLTHLFITFGLSSCFLPLATPGTSASGTQDRQKKLATNPRPPSSPPPQAAPPSKLRVVIAVVSPHRILLPRNHVLWPTFCTTVANSPISNNAAEHARWRSWLPTGLHPATNSSPAAHFGAFLACAPTTCSSCHRTEVEVCSPSKFLSLVLYGRKNGH
jgi:hypothetical protein